MSTVWKWGTVVVVCSLQTSQRTWEEAMWLLRMETNGQSVVRDRRRASERRREGVSRATNVFQSARACACRGVMHCPIEAQAREGRKEGGREGERERGRATHATFTHARSHKWKNLCQRSSFWTLADDARGPAAITMTDRPTIGRE